MEKIYASSIKLSGLINSSLAQKRILYKILEFSNKQLPYKTLYNKKLAEAEAEASFKFSIC